MKVKDWFKGLMKGGIRVGYSTGRPFDPRDQIRTEGMKDIIKRKEQRDVDNR